MSSNGVEERFKIQKKNLEELIESASKRWTIIMLKEKQMSRSLGNFGTTKRLLKKTVENHVKGKNDKIIAKKIICIARAFVVSDEKENEDLKRKWAKFMASGTKMTPMFI